MDKSLTIVCEALKKIFNQLKPQHHPVSFTIMTGKRGQGISTLLQQSNFRLYDLNNHAQIKIYYNNLGVILDLSESWLSKSNTLLQNTLKQLNHCHKHIRISGITLCVSLPTLCNADDLHAICDAHSELLKQFGASLNYRIDTAIIFTKTDQITGFCEFFQQNNTHELQKPLGFSLQYQHGNQYYISQFEQFIEAMGQPIVDKLHAIRSSTKRTLIREFPLQLASLNAAI